MTKQEKRRRACPMRTSPKSGPIGLPLLAGKSSHLKDPSGAQWGILRQGVADEVHIGIGLATCAILLGAIEAIGFQSRAYGIPMQVQLGSYGADLPMLGEKQKTDFRDQFGINHVSPACAEDLDEMPPASANDAEDAMETRLSATLAQVIRLLGGWRCRYQSPSSADPAARRWGRGRLICHAAETSAAILALAITVIEARFQAPLIASIGLPPLFSPGLLPTFCTAVGLPSIAGEADEKHLPAAHSAAKQLSKYKSCRHCLPGGSVQGPAVVQS